MKYALLFFIFCLNSMVCLAQTQEEYTLKKSYTEASCVDYAIFKNDKKIKLTTEISDALSCPSIIGLHKDWLFFASNNKVKQHNLNTNKTKTIFTLYPDIDGIDGPFWSPDHSKIAFTIVNQERKHNYQAAVRIITYDLNKKGEFSNKKKFDIDAYFDCGSRCGSEIKFIDNHTIQYRDIMDKGRAFDNVNYKYLKL